MAPLSNESREQLVLLQAQGPALSPQLYSLHWTGPFWPLAGACGQDSFLSHSGFFSEMWHSPRSVVYSECVFCFLPGPFQTGNNPRDDTECLGYSSNAVIRQHEQDSLQKKLFSWAYGFRALESILPRQHGSEQHTCWPEPLRALVLIHK